MTILASTEVSSGVGGNTGAMRRGHPDDGRIHLSSTGMTPADVSGVCQRVPRVGFAMLCF